MNSTVRCLVVWGATTAAAVLLVTWLLPEPVGGQAAGSGSFEPWLVSGCALAATGCLAWLWLLVTLVVVDGLRGRPTRAGVPAVVRRVVLAACGLSLTSGLVIPAHADRPAPPPESGTTQAILVGLPLPDRTTTTTEWVGGLATGPGPAAESTAPDAVQVEPGDTLWSIAGDSLPPGADAEEIDRRWRAIYRANLDAVGADPDLIRPGQRLQLPPFESHPR